MSAPERAAGMPEIPFPPRRRASGLLLHVTSLPSPYGIGDLGPAAHAWIDRLRDAGQRWWQVLPLGPTGFGDSPYQPLSSFAGNPLLIGPDGLVEDGLLRPGECEGARRPVAAVRYRAVRRLKDRLLASAWARFRRGERPDLREELARFRREHAAWLEDYALFHAIKIDARGEPWHRWPEALARREPGALDEARRALAGAVERACFEQMLFFRQAARLRRHARAGGVAIIGDLPFFVALDSADVWANPGLFLLDERFEPRFVAGVPPDAFSADGQLWGNPVHDWEAQRRDGYAWWIARLRALLLHVDVVRLDHFRGFAAAWHVPAGEATAANGRWVPGPGADLFGATRDALGSLPLLAEDLGLITEDVHELRDGLGLPGTGVLQFAFDGNPDNPYLPRNVAPETALYTATHDNDTTRGWYRRLPPAERRNLWRELGRVSGLARDVAPELVRLAWSSAAALAMAPLQDVLNLGSSARMNRPGRPGGNWRWRAAPEMLDAPALSRLRELTAAAGRDVG